MFRSSKLFIVVLIVLVFATAAFAFAANITGIPTTLAGEGSSVINGFAVSSLSYTLDATNASNINAVSFTLDPGADAAKVSLTPGTFYDCTSGDRVTWTCDTTSPQATVATATMLDLVAVDQ